MSSKAFLFLCVSVLSLAAFIVPGMLRNPAPVSAAAHTGTAPAYVPTYSKDGDLTPPLQYREWIYLTTGLGMNYAPTADAGMQMFDNVFVNPEAYQAFQATGTWPDKTVIVLEQRGAGSKASINKSGHFQSGAVMGLEVHVKDTSRFAGGWAFFDVANESKATLVPQTAPCYSCHADHAAVDTTFVQFYPTLLPIAQKKGTLSASYLKDLASAPKE